MKLATSILEYLRSHNGLKYGLILHFCSLNIYTPFRKTYENALGLQQQQQQQQQHSRSENADDSDNHLIDEDDDDDDAAAAAAAADNDDYPCEDGDLARSGPINRRAESKFSSIKRIASGRGREQSPEQSPDPAKQPNTKSKRQHELDPTWDWQGVPKCPKIYYYYVVLSTTWQCYVVAKHYFMPQLSGLINWLGFTDMPGHCYLVGRFEVYSGMSEPTGNLLATFNLVWRLVQVYWQRSYYSTTIMFMFQTKRDIKRFLRTFRKPRYNISTSNTVATLTRRRSSARRRRGHASLQEEFFESIMCYKSYDCRSGDRILHLRPNRDLIAHHEQTKAFAKEILFSGTIAAIIVFLAIVRIYSEIATDKRYMRRYPGCDPELELKTMLLGPSDWRMTLRWHHTLTAIIDIIESGFIWVDSGLSLFCGWSVCFAINYDLLAYWRDLDAKLSCLLERAKMSQRENQQKQFQQVTPSNYIGFVSRSPNLVRVGGGQSGGGGGYEQITMPRHHSQGYATKSEMLHSSMSYRRVASCQDNHHLGSDQMIADLQNEICDFLREIRRSDSIVSDILSMATCIWLTAFAYYGGIVLNYYLSEKPTLSGAPEGTMTDREISIAISLMTLFVLMGFWTLLVSSLYMLKLHFNCLKSYKQICFLMAYDTSGCRERYTKLIELLKSKTGTCFSLFNLYPYSALTFMSLFGWSVSCLLVFDNLFRHRIRG